MASKDNHNGPIGLSQRSNAVVQTIMPRISSAVAERTRMDNPKIDLSTAENWLLRDELAEICKDAISEGLEAKVRLSSLHNLYCSHSNK